MTLATSLFSLRRVREGFASVMSHELVA
jgi:hypothetical protein